MDKLRILVVDDHPLMRDALCAAIETDFEMELAGQGASGSDALELARALHPHVIVMDLMMPGMSGTDAMLAIHDEMPEIRFLALTSSLEPAKVQVAVQAGALGYLLKDAHREELLEAIRTVSRGMPYLPSQVTLLLMESLQASPVPVPSNADQVLADKEAYLTERQKQILELLGMGMGDREIAAALYISEATVRSHVFHIQGVLGMENRQQMIAYAARRQT